MKYALPFALCMAASLAASSASAANSSPILSVTVDHGVAVDLGRASGSVFVANPDIADVQVMSPTRIMIFGKRTGETSFMATDSDGRTLSERTIEVTQDLGELRQELDSAIPGNNIKASSVPNGIVLTGTAKDPVSVADANKIAIRYSPSGNVINRVEVVGSNQVMIRVRFAEVQRSINNTLGFDWQNTISGHNMLIGLSSGNTVNAPGSGTFNVGSTTGLFPRPNNSALSLPNDLLGITSKIGAFTIDGMIDALAQDGLLTVLAEPNLTAMSGETANFLAGGQFPIPIPQQNGSISIQFQPYGISLAFTPTILRGDRISLHVRPEVSELTTNGSIILNNISIPALTTRKAETTVEVGSGESFAIAGLMDNDQTQTVDKFPVLGDMPILGDLFRSSSFQNGQTELVVIITPYVVKPSKEQLALPTDGYSPPSEVDRLADQRFTSSNPNARPMSGDATGVAVAPSAAPMVPVTQDNEPINVRPTSDSSMKQLPAVSNLSTKPLPAPSGMSTNTSNNSVSARTAASMPAAPVVTAPSTATSPVVLHTDDKDNDGGGLLVE